MTVKELVKLIGYDGTSRETLRIVDDGRTVAEIYKPCLILEAISDYEVDSIEASSEDVFGVWLKTPKKEII